MILATYESSHFTFDALGQDEDEAFATLERTLVRHGAQYGLGHDWYKLGPDWRAGCVQFRDLQVGGGYRDGDLMPLETTEQLSDELAQWCKEQGVEYLSADDLLVDLSEHIGNEDDPELLSVLMKQFRYLQDFIKRWNAAQAQEDFEQACAARGEA